MELNVCLQCGLEAFVLGEPAPNAFPESFDEHRRTRHPDLTPEKRAEWIRRAAEKLERELAVK